MTYVINKRDTIYIVDDENNSLYVFDELSKEELESFSLDNLVITQAIEPHAILHINKPKINVNVYDENGKYYASDKFTSDEIFDMIKKSYSIDFISEVSDSENVKE